MAAGCEGRAAGSNRSPQDSIDLRQDPIGLWQDSIDLRGIRSVSRNVDERPRAMSAFKLPAGEDERVTFFQGDSQLNEYRVVDDNRGLSGLSYLLLEKRLRNTA